MEPGGAGANVEVVGDGIVEAGLDAPDLGLGHLLQRHHGQRRGPDEGRRAELEVRVVVVEGGGLEAQAPARRLDADLVGADRFLADLAGVEPGPERAARGPFVVDRGHRVPLAAAEALGIGEVDAGARRDLVADRGARGELAVLRTLGGLGEGVERRRHPAHRNAAGAAAGGPAIEALFGGDVLRFLAVAAAEGDAEPVGQVIGAVDEQGPGLLGPAEVDRLVQLVGRQRRARSRAGRRQVGGIGPPGGIAGRDVVVIAAQHEVEPVDRINVEVDRLLPCPIVDLGIGIAARGIGAVEIVGRHQVARRIAGDRPQGADPGIPLELERTLVLLQVQREDVARVFAEAGGPQGAGRDVLGGGEEHPARIAGMQVVVGQRRPEAVAQLGLQLDPDRLLAKPEAAPVEGARRGRAQALVEAVGVPEVAGNDDADGVRQRPRDIAAHPAVVVAAVGALDVAFEVVGRVLGVDQDRAARGVAAIERSLRPLEHLDAVDRGQVHVQDLRGELVKVVDEDRDVVLVGAGVDRGDAADRHLRIGAAVADLEPGGDVLEVAHRVDADAAERLLADDLDRHRHLLQPLGAALGGDQDLVAVAGPFLGRGAVLREGRQRGRRQDQRGAEQQRAPGAWTESSCADVHAALPCPSRGMRRAIFPWGSRFFP